MPALRPVDEVVDELLGYVEVTRKTELRSLDDALNCCVASDIQSEVHVPPQDNSAMDGYAMAFSDAELNRIYEISDRIPAGYIGNALVPGTLARIFTGASIPAGADTVVMQENTKQIDDGIELTQLPRDGENVRRQGQDIEQGATIVKGGDRLTAKTLGLVASVGVSKLEVKTPLKVAIMSTGDELVEPGEAISPGQIYNSNRFALAGMLKTLGFDVLDLGIVEDTREATLAALERAAEQADLILTSGGVSVGEEDHVKGAVETLGRLDVWKMAIKPGKPLAYGNVKGTPIFGLPGNPVSTYVTFHVVARTYLLAMQGFSKVQPDVYTVRSAFDFSGGGRREYLRVKLHNRDGATYAERFSNQGSGIMTSVVWADALAVAEVGQQIHPGDALTVLPLTGL
ncbi:MAG: molybdopterin molybdotransferase MoeA [Pseudomonadales bacterium]|nr:molybdopterin molybdotransferase MoeA [Pseudomonadales bacterium]MBO6700811.1 molybdopterin molybdotransferase MoeA [Pseudomonadales bacterium]MBO7004869.1 molybdopterin molybdotransferase MoeA [Pseudomonadales bacterium]